MPCSNFTLKKVKKAFQLQETVQNLFPNVQNLEISDWLQQTLYFTPA